MEIKKYLINKDDILRNALKQMDKGAKKILFVVNSENCLIGALTDGDVRRWILKTGGITGKVDDVYNKNPKHISLGYTRDEIKEFLIKYRIEAAPVVDEDNKLVDILFWEKVFSDDLETIYDKMDIPVVIMAGGKGTRLAPFTNILPKPLIPVGDKTILETIIDQFKKYSINHYYLSVNYKAKMIEVYLEEINSGISVEFLKEDQPLGTAGALKGLTGNVNEDFIVTNCDILIDHDLKEIVSYHKENKKDLTLVASVQHYTVNYGVCELNDSGDLQQIKEKPQFDFLVNTGMYLINPALLDLIPENEKYDMTNLIDDAKQNGYKVGVFPVSEKSWIDIGQWEEYQKSLKILDEKLKRH